MCKMNKIRGKKQICMLIITTFYLISYDKVYSQKNMTADTILPKKVIATFNKMFPNASSEEWVVRGDTFIITYFSENEWFEITINRNGSWMATSEITDYDHLPPSVRQSFDQSEFADEAVPFVKFEEKIGPKKKIHIKYWLVFTEDSRGNEVILKYDESGKRILD